MESDHLIETFYITKPRYQPREEEGSDQGEGLLDNIEEIAKVNWQEKEEERKGDCQDTSGKHCGTLYERQLRMISKQINCSAAVTIHPIKKKRKRTGKTAEQPKDHKFMNQFQTFFKSFVPKENKDENRSSIKRKSAKYKTKLVTPQTNPVSAKDQSLETDSEDEFGKTFTRNENKPHLTFYEKLKNNLEQKVEHLVDKNQKERYKKIETKAKSNKSVHRILKEKNDLKSCESHLRLSRTGLVIRLDAMQQKPGDSSLKKIQNQKAKKDMMFQRCLVKNCQIVLQNITNYERTAILDRQARPSAKNHKKHSSTITQKTFSSAQKRTIQPSSSVQDLQLLKWREKCMKIELTCKRSTSNSIGLKQGLKVFKKYSKKLHKKFETTQKEIDGLLQQSCEKDEQACRLYDSMANIEPINNFMQSIQ